MRIALSFIVAALLCTSVDAAPETTGRSLTLPDGSVLPRPPTFPPTRPRLPSSAIGETPKTPDVAKPADPPLSASERRKQSLDELYGRLAQAKDPVEAAALSDRITSLFLRSGSDTADLLMQRAMAAMAAKTYGVADSLLDKLIVLRPHWAEAWNKRATVRYLEDDDVGSMGDIGQVLLLEPRHIGALSGMGLILHRNGNDKGALTVFRKALAIDPQDAQVKTFIDQLGPDVEGHEL